MVAGTKLDLPLWMVRNLAERGFISLQCVAFFPPLPFSPLPFPPPLPASLTFP